VRSDELKRVGEGKKNRRVRRGREKGPGHSVRGASWGKGGCRSWWGPKKADGKFSRLKKKIRFSEGIICHDFEKEGRGVLW